MNTSPEVLTLGECMAVLSPAGDQPLQSSQQLLLDIGGAEANVALALTALGHSSRFISKLGRDPLGARIRETLSQAGVQTESLIEDEARHTGLYLRERPSDHSRQAYYYRAHSAASSLHANDIQEDWFPGATFVHLTGITPALSASCLKAVQQAMSFAQEHGVRISFDVNYRAPLWNAELARATLLPLLERTDIIFLSQEDRTVLFGELSEEEIVTLYPEQMVICKRGEQGASAYEKGNAWHVPTQTVTQVVDTIGAGDAFDAGFLAGLLRKQSPEEALHLGARVGAAVATSPLDYYHGQPLP